MNDRLTLSRAARLADMLRGDMQARIKQLGIETFEGSISHADLLKAYPDIELDSDPELERVAEIKRHAFARHGRTDFVLPDVIILLD
jgi:CDP-4-dehydro-6-deoxyglucose reductase